MPAQSLEKRNALMCPKYAITWVCVITAFGKLLHLSVCVRECVRECVRVCAFVSVCTCVYCVVQVKTNNNKIDWLSFYAVFHDNQMD